LSYSSSLGSRLGASLPESGSIAGFRNVVFFDGQVGIKETVSVSLQNRQIPIVSKPVVLFRDHIGCHFVIGYRFCTKSLKPAFVKRTINFYSPYSSIMQPVLKRLLPDTPIKSNIPQRWYNPTEYAFLMQTVLLNVKDFVFTSNNANLYGISHIISPFIHMHHCPSLICIAPLYPLRIF